MSGLALPEGRGAVFFPGLLSGCGGSLAPLLLWVGGGCESAAEPLVSAVLGMHFRVSFPSVLAVVFLGFYFLESLPTNM